MASSQIKLTVVGTAGGPLLSPAEASLFNTAFIARCVPYTPGTYTGAATEVQYFKSGPAGGSFIKLYVTETQDQIVALANVDTAPSLNVLTTLTVAGLSSFGSGILFKPAATVAINSSATIASGDMTKGYFTSTSAAATTITLRTATQLATELGVTGTGVYRFIVDNSAGANTVTVAVATGVTVGTTALTGGDSLTVSTAQAVAEFELVFKSATTATLRRVL